MPRGGAKPGERRGGRKKGTKNRAIDTTARAIKEATRATREAIQQAGAAVANREVAERFADASELTPLAYMLDVMRDETVEPWRRDNAARSCMQFCHPALKSVVVDHTLKIGIEAELASLVGDLAPSNRLSLPALEGSAVEVEQPLQDSRPAGPPAPVQDERRADGDVEAAVVVEPNSKGSPTRH